MISGSKSDSNCNQFMIKRTKAAISIQNKWRNMRRTLPFEVRGIDESNFGIWKQTGMFLVDKGIDEILNNPSLIPEEARVASRSSLVGLWGSFWYKVKEIVKYHSIPGFVVEPSNISSGEVKSGKVTDFFNGTMKSRDILGSANNSLSNMEFELNEKKFKIARLVYELCNQDLDNKHIVVPRTVKLHDMMAPKDRNTCKLSWVTGLESRNLEQLTIDIGSGTMKAVDPVTGKISFSVECSPSMSNHEIKKAIEKLIEEVGSSNIQDAYATGSWRYEQNAEKLSAVSISFKVYNIEVNKLPHDMEAEYGSKSLLRVTVPHSMGINMIASYEFGRGSTQIVLYERASIEDIRK